MSTAISGGIWRGSRMSLRSCGLRYSYAPMRVSGSLGRNAALPDALPPPELWVASSSQGCRIHYSAFDGRSGSDTRRLLFMGRWVSEGLNPSVLQLRLQPPFTN